MTQTLNIIFHPNMLSLLRDMLCKPFMDAVIRIRPAMLRITVLLIILTMCFSGSACSSDTAVSDQIHAIETTLQKQLPVGSRQDDVIKFLQNQNIEYSSYQYSTPRILGIIRDVERDLLTSTSIQLEFIFDDEGRMTRYAISKVFTGL